VAADLEEGYRDGAFFVALGPITDPMLVPTTIAQALGLREEPSRSPTESLLHHLGDRQVLLVLDNFEQILDGAAVVGELLAGTTDVRVLVTSREALQIHGEQEYPVPPLALPDVAHLPPLETLSQYEAVRLFVERAAAVRPGFAVTNQNAPAVAEICTRLDGLPLAIELAAARVKLLAPEEILKRLGHRLDLLSGGARDLPARQRTLRGAIDWSYDLLDEPEKVLFARLALFSGGFTLEALEAICAPGLDLDTFEGIASLTNKSLVRQRDAEHADETRFFTLQTIWEYAAERFLELPDADELKGRHAAHFLDLVTRSAPELFGPRQAELLDQLAYEHDNFRTAIAASIERGDVETALLLGANLWRYWQMRGHLLEASERLRALVDLSGAEEHPEALAAALEGAGGVHYWMADWERAKDFYARCLELRRTLDDRGALAEAIYNLSFLFTVPPPPRQDLDRGRDLLREAETLFREVDDRSGLAKVLWGLGSTGTVQNDWDSAVAFSLEAADLFRELGDRFSLGWALNSLGTGYLGKGELEAARDAFEEGLDLFLGAGDVTGIGLLLGDISLLSAMEGDHARGALLRGAALRVEEQSGQGLVTNLDVYMPWDLDLRRGPLPQEEWDRLVDDGGRLSVDEAVALARKRD
jgi:predicted ATPase